MSDLATKQYVIDMIGRYVGQSSGGGGTVPDDPAGIIKTCKDYTDAQITNANTYTETVAGNARADAEAAAKNYTDAEIAKCNSYAEQQAVQARTDATTAAKNYTDAGIDAANKYAEDQAAAAMGEANRTILSYVRARFTELDYEFRDVAITNAWQDIYYVDVARPAALANKHIVSTMIVQTYGGAPMGVYPTAPGDTSGIRFISPVSKTMHVTVRFLILTKDEDETT